MSKNGNNEGSITKRKDGRWQGMISCGRKPNGSINRKYFYGKTRKEVADKLHAALHEYAAGTYIDTSISPTLQQWINDWLWTYKRKALKPTTFEQYETMLRVHIIPALGGIQLPKLTAKELQLIYNSKIGILSARSLHLLNTILHECLKQAVLNGYIQKNVCEAVVLPRDEHKPMRVLTPDEEHRFIEVLSQNRLGKIGRAHV